MSKVPAPERVSLDKLLRFDPEEPVSAPDADPNFDFKLVRGFGDDMEELTLEAGHYTDGVLVYCYPHRDDVREYKTRGYEIEKLSPTGVHPAGLDEDDVTASLDKDIEVKDHVCMSLPVEEFVKRRRAELYRGNQSLLAMRRQEEAPLTVTD